MNTTNSTEEPFIYNLSLQPKNYSLYNLFMKLNIYELISYMVDTEYVSEYIEKMNFIHKKFIVEFPELETDLKYNIKLLPNENEPVICIKRKHQSEGKNEEYCDLFLPRKYNVVLKIADCKLIIHNHDPTTDMDKLNNFYNIRNCLNYKKLLFKYKRILESNGRSFTTLIHNINLLSPHSSRTEFKMNKKS